VKEQILVAVDGSDNSFEALEEAVKLAEVFQSNIVLVNVQPSYHTIHTRLFINDELIKEFQQEQCDTATSYAVQYLEDQKLDYELILKIGDPTQQISKLARELKVKYIVMGSRGMGLVRGTVLGSVSNGVLHESEIPMLIIPQKHKK
jgi:nucleotide-binding universal stress UspA family protein